LREKHIPTAMIDISDGLSTDLSHICEESGVGAELWQEKLPRQRIGPRKVDLAFALHGGEAYELLFTARPGAQVARKIAGIPITLIGETTRGKRLSLVRPDGTRSSLKIRGWEHCPAMIVS
jgi:thiamine-monophosphate kinase